MTTLLTTAYWPNLHYFYYVLHSEAVTIEACENYQKQSFRNRTHILSANGLLPLTVPVHKKAVKELTKDIGISYQENWPIKHWRAITSAYKNSPYFDFFETEIHSFYSQRYATLLEYNLQQLKLLSKLLKQEKKIGVSNAFTKESSTAWDLRSISNVQTDFRKDALVRELLEKPYYQTFGNKFPFHPNLSVLDLLFNTGLKSLDYLG